MILTLNCKIFVEVYNFFSCIVLYQSICNVNFVTFSMAGSQVASSCLLDGSYDRHAVLMTASKVGAGAVIAFAMELSEYLVVVNTSSLTLSIAGVFKVIFALLSTFFFKTNYLELRLIFININKCTYFLELS